VDFEHERREEVIQYIYKRFGRDHSGLAAAVVTYRARSAMREIGKAFGLSNDFLAPFAHGRGGADRSSAAPISRARLRPQRAAPRGGARPGARTRRFPRHLTQHSGGFVITRARLDEVVPVRRRDGRPHHDHVDKDDLDALGILKIDVLALGMLTCLRKGWTSWWRIMA